MAWMAIQQSLPQHRKIMRLRRSLKIGTAQAVGHMCMLWLWCLDSAQDGDLSGLLDCDIAEAAGYEGKKPDEFLRVLIDAGFIDSNMHIHNWDEHAGQFMDGLERSKAQTRKRVERYRARQKEQAVTVDETLPSVTSNVTGNATQKDPVTLGNGDTLHYTTLHNNTLQNGGNGAASPQPSHARFTPPSLDEVRAYCQERGNTVDPEKWHDFYASKGWMVGKNKMRDWKAAVRTWEKEDAIRPRTATDPNSRPYIPDDDNDFGIEKNF